MSCSAPTSRAWLEVDLDALRRNAESVRARSGARLLPMVKADGYGLGAVRVAGALRGLDPWGYGVATVEEGIDLRAAGIEGRIVVFWPGAHLDPRPMRDAHLEPAVTSLEAMAAYADHANTWDGPVPVHLEIDTGMGRSGLPDAMAEEWLPAVAAAVRGERLRLVSTFTHFHSAGTSRTETREQWRRYQVVLGMLREAGVDPGLRHAGNSAGALRYPELDAEVVRPGLYLYGGGSEEPCAEPVARVRARVLDVRDVPAGWTVGYGGTYTTPAAARLATLGIGYADGLPHAASNRGVALVRGRRVPIRGVVCMDVTVVEVPGEVRPGAVATLLGRDGSEEVTLEEFANTCGMVEYEILTGFGPRLHRLEAGTPADVPDDATAHAGIAD